MLYRIKPLQQLKIKQQQRLIIRHEMKQAFQILQMPIEELTSYVDDQIEQNPILEKNYSNINMDASKHFHTTAEESSLFSHLINQAKEFFNEKDLEIAEKIIGNLDKKGYFSFPVEDFALSLQIPKKKILSILKKIQSFDPVGIASVNLQEFLLTQLKHFFPKEKILFQIIKNYFDLFLHQKFHLLAKKYSIKKDILNTKIQKVFVQLQQYPSQKFQKELTHYITPDITIRYEQNKWIIKVINMGKGSIKLSDQYLSLTKEKSFLRPFYHRAKWLVKCIKKRKELLVNITIEIIKKQKNFLLNDGDLLPLEIKVLSQKMNVHPSTIRRAIANKYIKYPFGLLPVSYFFSKAISSSNDKISKRTAKQLLKKLINEEDKKSPLSDHLLSKKLSSYGIKCARRTINKYRKELLIGSISERKKY